MRRSFTLIAPVATGALVLALAAAYPASAVRGSGLTGPKPPRSVIAAPLGTAYRLRWVDHDRRIALRVRDGARCRPRLEQETSTGPARIEVVVARPTGASCSVDRRWWVLRLRPPTLRAAWQPVDTYVDGERAVLPAPPGPAAGDGPDGQGTVQ